MEPQLPESAPMAPEPALDDGGFAVFNEVPASAASGDWTSAVADEPSLPSHGLDAGSSWIDGTDAPELPGGGAPPDRIDEQDDGSSLDALNGFDPNVVEPVAVM